MKTNLFRIIILTITALTYCFASDMRIVIGEAALTESDIKRYSRDSKFYKIYSQKNR